MKVLVLLVTCVVTTLCAPQSQGPHGTSGSSTTGSSSNAAAPRITRLLGDIYSALGDRANGLSPCVFPFTHKGTTYRACTTDDDFYGMYWCSTKVNSDGVHESDWRHCQESDGLEGGQEVTKPTLCEDAGGKCLAPDVGCENGLKRKGLCGKNSNKECCIQNEKGCNLGTIHYKNGDYNGDTCLKVICINGDWFYTGQHNPECGTCNVDGDPHFHMFDKTNFLYSRNPPRADNEYKFGGTGSNYVITQHELGCGSAFGLHATFGTCNDKSGEDLSCITSVKYYEPGLTVEFTLPDMSSASYPPFCSNAENVKLQRCRIKVEANGRPIEPLTGKAVNALTATNGNVLVFNHNDIKGDPKNLLCMNVIGTQGLSVSLCEYEDNFAFLYVTAMPNLKSNPSKLYGMCNTYSGVTQKELIVPSGAGTQNPELFGNQWGHNGHCNGDNVGVTPFGEFSVACATSTLDPFKSRNVCPTCTAGGGENAVKDYVNGKSYSHPPTSSKDSVLIFGLPLDGKAISYGMVNNYCKVGVDAPVPVWKCDTPSEEAGKWSYSECYRYIPDLHYRPNPICTVSIGTNGGVLDNTWNCISGINP